MKAMIRILMILAVTLVTLVQPTDTSAATNWRYTGKSVEAYFYGEDSSSCILTYIWVFAGEDVFQDIPGEKIGSSAVQVVVNHYDNCTGEQLLFGQGYMELAEADLEFSNSLRLGMLIATVNIYDYVSDNWFDVVLDLTWTGVGPTYREESHSHEHFPGCNIVTHNRGTRRDAEVSGSLSDGVATFDVELLYAMMFSAKHGSVSADCG